jgi:hypothetical protein
VASRFSSLINQDIIDNHTREVADLTEQFLKIMVKCSIPLTGLIIVLGLVLTMEPLIVLV